LWWIIQSERN